MAGAASFTTASLLCGLAWSPAALPAARVVHGAGAAIMTPTALSIISTTFTEGAERNKALGIWGALDGIGATTAWLIGGPLVDGPGKAGFRPVAATGMALMAAGSLVLTQVSIHGSYFPDIFVGLLLCGMVACAVLAGTGLTLAFLLPADRGSQRTSCQSRTRRPMLLPQETW
jgi:MFS family permease